MTNGRPLAEAPPHPYRATEEKLNSITHAIGAGLAVAALIVLLIASDGKAIAMTAFALYGVSQILTYLSSSLLHGFHDTHTPKLVFRRMDYSSIYLLIAGTYTPVALIAIGGTTGWIVFAIEWTLALLGVVARSVFVTGRSPILDSLYLPMGWLIVFFFRPLLASMEPGFLWWAVAGGLSYTVGIVFYFLERVPMAHVVWHLFVLGGGVSFFVAFLRYLV